VRQVLGMRRASESNEYFCQKGKPFFLSWGRRNRCRDNGGSKNTRASLYLQLYLAPAPLAYVNQPKERVAVKGYHCEQKILDRWRGIYGIIKEETWQFEWNDQRVFFLWPQHRRGYHIVNYYQHNRMSGCSPWGIYREVCWKGGTEQVEGDV
jgi:hypothetical protein